MSHQYFIRLTSPQNGKVFNWCQDIQNWSTNEKITTFFNTAEEADGEAVYARRCGPGKVTVVEREITPATIQTQIEAERDNFLVFFRDGHWSLAHGHEILDEAGKMGLTKTAGLAWALAIVAQVGL